MAAKRYTPDELRETANWLDKFAGTKIDVSDMLKQAADDCERLQEAVALLAKCPKVTDDMYVGRDSEGYGKQARAFVKAHKART